MQTFLINIKRFFESSLQFFFKFYIWVLNLTTTHYNGINYGHGNGMVWKWNGMEMEMENTTVSDKSIHIKISPHLKEKGNNF